MRKRDAINPLKEAPLRNPGQSLDERVDRLLNERLIGLLLIPLMLWAWTGMEWFAEWRNAPRTPGLYALVAFVATFYCGWHIRNLRAEIRSTVLGRDGERIVGQSLEELRETGARVFHDVPVIGFNIDHVVVSQHGIFVVETKTWTKAGPDSRIHVKDGRLYKDGVWIADDPIKQAVDEAKALQKILRRTTRRDFAVQAVLIFPGWYIERMDRATKNIAWVLNLDAFIKWFGYEPVKFTLEQVSMISDHLDGYIRSKGAQSGEVQ